MQRPNSIKIYRPDRYYESFEKDAMDSVSKDNFGESGSTVWSFAYNQNSGEAVYYYREDEDYDKSYLFRIGS